MDNHIFEVTLPGVGKEEFGILTHGDVVPAVADEWVLDNGNRLDPFKMTKVGGYLYGRGTIDDKGSIAAALYAMKAVKESGVQLARTIRLMIETSEETSGEGMEYYRVAPRCRRTTSYWTVSIRPWWRKKARRPEGAVPGASRRRKLRPSSRSPARHRPTPFRKPPPHGSRGAIWTASRRVGCARAAFIRKYEAQGGKFSIEVKRIADAVDVKVTGVSAQVPGRKKASTPCRG